MYHQILNAYVLTMFQPWLSRPPQPPLLFPLFSKYRSLPPPLRCTLLTLLHTPSECPTASTPLPKTTPQQECTNPIHLTLDTELSEADASIVRTYVSRGVGIEDRSLATEFMEIPNEATMAEVRTIGFETVAAQRQERVPTDVEALQRSLARLRGLLDTVFKYVDDVCSGKRRGDPQVGRVLSEVVSLAASALSKEEVERALNDAQQDSMLVLYLSTLVRTQLALADKLQTATLPIFMSS